MRTLIWGRKLTTPRIPKEASSCLRSLHLLDKSILSRGAADLSPSGPPNRLVLTEVGQLARVIRVLGLPGQHDDLEVWELLHVDQLARHLCR